MNIVIVGPGAIGSLWAYSLYQAGHKVSLWSKHIRSTSSLTFENVDGEIHPHISFPAQEYSQLNHADLILVTVKAWQVTQALSPLLEHIHTDTILMFMQNGMGATDELFPALKHYPTLLATTTHGAWKPSPDCVRHTGLGQTTIGALNSKGESCQFIADVFDHALPKSLWVNDISVPLWAKLAVNCVINPLTAIHRCKNGQLLNDTFTTTINNLVEELALVMSQEGMSITPALLRQQILSVAQATADNFSSMQQDIIHQRPTEIDFINGYLVKIAQKHGIKTPENKQLFQQIKKLEKQWSQL